MSTQIDLTDGRFSAMGSACRVVCDLGPEAIRFAINRLEVLEGRWSRFRGDSEVSRCNLHAGEWVEVSRVTRDLVARSMAAFERTKGRFHPLMLRELVELGYDRSAEHLEPPARDDVRSIRQPHRAAEEPIEIDGSAVRVPAGFAFDPSGLGKGLAADVLVAELVDGGARWVVVSIGTDLRLGGSAVGQQGWDIEVENPWSPGTMWARARMHAGGLATSATHIRQWVGTGGPAHHLLDPRTCLPTSGSRVAATAHAADAWWADVVAKCVIVDQDLDAETLDEWGAIAVAFHCDGAIEELGWQADAAFAVAS